ncbi:hypothetical protein AGMMS4957_16020 [Bacteroidia bacterium]|nr:hypothetical protein AGMMS4957_16020 [Bacteroidia bacterium]
MVQQYVPESTKFHTILGINTISGRLVYIKKMTTFAARFWHTLMLNMCQNKMKKEYAIYS